MIADGRLQIRGDGSRELDVGVLDVIDVRVDARSRRLVCEFTNRPPVTLKGVRRRVVAEIDVVLSAEVEDQLRLRDRAQAAAAQGEAARRWWAAANATLKQPRWIDRATVAAIARERPDVGRWVAAYGDPRLADFVAGRPPDERAAVDACVSLDLDRWVTNRNERFVEWEKVASAEFFQTVEKSPLTDEQIQATICFDNRVRVIASAGSGKTSTMVARAGYAVRRGIAEQQEILMLAFNKKAAAELSARTVSRLGEQGAGVAAATFHSFGLRVIGAAMNRKPTVPDDLAQDNGMKRLAELVDRLRDHDDAFRRDWDLFRLVFGRQLPELGNEADPEVADRDTGAQGFKTLAGEVVKSQEESMIANWLFLNGVKYEYERPYEHDVADAEHRQYQPDFYYPDIDTYHEHWALGRDGTPPAQFVGYAESMQWRRRTHADFGTQLIETTSATIRDGSGFEHLKQELMRRGVELDENPYREAVGEPPISDHALVALMRSFMVHVKGNRLSGEDLAKRAGADRLLRYQLFVRLFTVLVEAWDRELRAENQIDFEDMLNLATDHIEAGRWVSPYRVVMVDEMQDTSSARAGLVRALLRQPGTFLYAVGDDWQSINRFAGSDLSVMTRFTDWFGEGETVLLTRTFRSPQSLCDVAGAFVMRNPAQLEKQVQSAVPEPERSLIAIGVSDRSEYGDVVQRYLTAIDADLDAPATVLLLSRYSNARGGMADALRTRYAHLSVEFNTVHAAKGKEADYVVVLGLESGGFPSQVEDDPVLQLAMAAPDPFPAAEERRLFYVALTRARRSVLLLTRMGRESPFLLELIRTKAVRVESAAGADITPTICPRCMKRSMRRRNGRNGVFLGCTGYPLCTGTKNVRLEEADKMLRADGA